MLRIGDTNPKPSLGSPSGFTAADSWLVGGLFAGPVVARELLGTLDPSCLLAEERAALNRPAHGRLCEFAAGRTCARLALAQFGIAGFPLGIGAGRMPLWPMGLIGSITHTECYTAAVVGESRLYEGIGVDAECVEAVEPRLWRAICTGDELLAIQQQPPLRRRRAAALIFSAKEALYKCIYPRLHARLGFADVSVDVGPAGWHEAAGAFRVHFHDTGAGVAEYCAAALRGRFQFSGNRVLAGVAWHARAQ